MAGKPFHFHPEKDRAGVGADLFEGVRRRIVNLLDILSGKLLPFVRLQNIKRERVNFACRAADPVAVVFNNKKDGQLLLFGEAKCFEKIALARSGVAHGRDNEIFLTVEFNSPRNAAGGKKLRAGWGWDAPNVAIAVAVMRRHHAAAAAGLSLGEIFESKLTRRHPTTKNQPAITIVGNDVVAGIKLNRDGSKRFVAHPGHMKVPFAL